VLLPLAYSPSRAASAALMGRDVCTCAFVDGLAVESGCRCGLTTLCLVRKLTNPSYTVLAGAGRRFEQRRRVPNLTAAVVCRTVAHGEYSRDAHRERRGALLR
jgi:hypothetical protein